MRWGRGRLRASGLRNGEDDRERIPQEQWADLQFYWTTPSRESRRYLPQSVNRSSRYVGPRDRLQHNATYWTNVLLDRQAVLALWPDPVPDLLRAKIEPLSLAEAVALLVRGRPASKEAWRRLRRRHGGCFPAAVQQQIGEAGQEIVEILRERKIAASGRPSVRDKGTGRMEPTDDGMKRLDDEFLAERPWVDLCADAIWTEPDLDDGRFNPVDRGYCHVVLDRAQFLEAVRIWSAPARPESEVGPRAPDSFSNAPSTEDGLAEAGEIATNSSGRQQQAPRRFSTAELERWYRAEWIERNEQEGKIPSRDDDLRAARSEVSPNVARDPVRQLRQKFAPESWRRRGRRKKIGGN